MNGRVCHQCFRTISMLSLLMGLAVVSSAATITVLVGYADNLRPSGFFPTPWLTTPGVVSQSPDGQVLDSGAVRIDNLGAVPIVVSNMTVTLPNGNHIFTLWNPLTIPAGGIGIFAQNNGVDSQFDTSDFGIFGAGPVNVDATHPLGGCTNPANAAQVTLCDSNQPIVSFSLDGGSTFTTLLDTGHILDTFGYDLINLPPPGGDGNESINWNVIGQVPTRDGGVPEPATSMMLGGGLSLLWAQRRFKRSRPIRKELPR
jgi:hypothetical protein